MTTWNLLRAAGIGSYVMLFLSFAWGLLSTTSFFGKRLARPSITLMHQFFSTTGLVLLLAVAIDSVSRKARSSSGRG